MANAHARGGIALVGFDADDTLWRSQDYFDEAQRAFERIVAGYVDLADVADRLYAVEKRNIALLTCSRPISYPICQLILSSLPELKQCSRKHHRLRTSLASHRGSFWTGSAHD